MTRRLRRLFCSAAIAIAGIIATAEAQEPGNRVLYVTHSAGYRHEVLELSQGILQAIGSQSGTFAITPTEDLSIFTPEKLRPYAAIVFFTSGQLPMGDAQKRAFLDFIRRGHGFIGLHSATDTFYQWRDYLDLIGGYFNDHPWHQRVTIDVADRTSPLVAFLGRSFTIDDEIYQISDFDYRRSHVLLRLDPASVDVSLGTIRPRFYGWPLAWTRSYGKGRVFYTALGHEASVWRDPRYQQLLLNAILWATRREPRELKPPG